MIRKEDSKTSACKNMHSKDFLTDHPRARR